MRSGWVAVLAVAALATSILACGVARAGELIGRVKVSNAPAPEKNRKRYPVGGGPAAADEPVAAHPLQDVIVYLEGAKGGHGLRPKPSMAQENKSFKPRVLPIKVGTEVGFPNMDPFYHNVFSYSKLKKFDLGRYPTGQSKSITFTEAGVVKVFCEIHSQMKGYIVVLDTDAFCVPDDSGAIRIKDIPPGKYNLVAWHPSFDPKVRPIEIGAGAVEVEIEF